MFGAAVICAGVGGVCDDTRPWPKGCVFDLDPTMVNNFQMSGSNIVSIMDRSSWRWEMFSSGSIDMPSITQWTNGRACIQFVGVEGAVSASCFLDTGPSLLPSILTQNANEQRLDQDGNGPQIFCAVQCSQSLEHGSIGYFGQRQVEETTFYKSETFIRIAIGNLVFGSGADVDWSPIDRNIFTLRATGLSNNINKSVQNNNGVVVLNGQQPGINNYSTSSSHATLGCRYWIITDARAFQWTGKLGRAVYFDRILTPQEQQFVFDRLQSIFGVG